jgi:hypothetical protein
MSNDLLYFNGIDGATGDYLLPPMTPGQLAALALGEQIRPDERADLEDKGERSRERKLSVEFGVDPLNLASAGWGVIFSEKADPAVREALVELLQWRQEQASAGQELYREFGGADGYRARESKSEFLARFGMGPGPAKPSKVPYYLLIVGPPEEIPYSFQYQLDVQYSVGRIHFDTPEEYARYARSVVEAESGKLNLARRAAFFGVQNDDDPATNLSAQHLVAPLAQSLVQYAPGWSFETLIRADATKANLLGLLGGSKTPAVLFTASHGMAFPNNDSRQRDHQGAILTQDYPGPLKWRKAIPQSHYLAGDDIASDARLGGLIDFHFACYGAGTPEQDDFPLAVPLAPSYIPKRPFVARLPQRLLAHPKGGALAVIGHVERAWGYSFLWDNAGAQLGAFATTLGYILNGVPVGHALDSMNGRYAELATDLASELNDIRAKIRPADQTRLAGLWTANNDARSYILLGDPAVRVAVRDESAPAAERASIRVRSSSPPADTTAAVAAPSAARSLPPAATEPFPAASTAAVPGPVMVDYGLGDDLRGATDKLRESLKTFADKLGDLLQRTVDDVTRLEVATYVAGDMTVVSYNSRTGKFEGDVQLRALTSIKLEGDTVVCVPQRAGEVDEALWQIHSDTVTQAQSYRTELLKSAVSAAAGLFNAFKPAG